MPYDIEPKSKRWEEIINTPDVFSQGRKIRIYICELESKVSGQENEIRELQRKYERIRKQVLSLDIVKEGIKQAENNEFERCNNKWDGYQEGV